VFTPDVVTMKPRAPYRPGTAKSAIVAATALETAGT
jgi:hypothetical protein